MAERSEVAVKRTGWKRPSVMLVVTAVMCTVLFVWPVAMIIFGAFRSDAPTFPASWTLDPLLTVYSNPATYETLTSSLGMAVGVSILSKGLGLYFAWLVARTDTPLRGLLGPVMALVLTMPPLFFAISWGMLGNHEVGLINDGFQALTGSGWRPVNIESWPGLIFVSVLKSTAMGYLLLIGPFLAMDRSQEEAAFTAGASRLRTFFTVNLPALGPAVVGVVVLGIVIGLEYFDIPLVLGTPAGITVFSTQIYGYLNDYSPPRYPEASATTIVLVLLLIVLLVAQSRLLRRRAFVTVGGKGSKREAWPLGRWRYVGSVVIAGYVLLALILPVIQLVLVSLTPYFGTYGPFTLYNYQLNLSDPAVLGALQTTAWLSALGGLLAVSVALAIVYTVRHHGGLGASFLRFTTWLPFAIPGTALALGMLWAYVSVPVLSSLYGTTVFLLIGLVVAATPLAMRTVEPPVLQVSRQLEEAAWVSGLRRGPAFVLVVCRVILPSFLVGWLITGILISGNLTIPLMLGSVHTQTVPALVFQQYTGGYLPQAAALLCIYLGAIAAVALLIGILRWIAGKVVVTRRDVPDGGSESQDAGNGSAGPQALGASMSTDASREPT